MQAGSIILGTGSALPKKILTNHELSTMVETSDEWIRERTGIRERRISNTQGEEFNSDLAAKASKLALEAADVAPDDVDCLILATSSPDFRLPSTSSIVQQKIGIKNECPCIDLQAACTGFVYSYVIADSLIRAGVYKNVLIVGSEMLSPNVNWEDRTTCILFSDGAGAALLGPSEEAGVLASKLGCDGSGGKFLSAPAGGCVWPMDHKAVEEKAETIRMDGKQIFKYATRTLIGNAHNVLEQADKNVSDVDWLVPHQANLRIIEYVAKKLEMDLNKVVVTVDKYGNNSAATIPLALDEAIRDGRIKRGDTIMFDAFGAGVTSGAILLKY